MTTITLNTNITSLQNQEQVSENQNIYKDISFTILPTINNTNTKNIVETPILLTPVTHSNPTKQDFLSLPSIEASVLTLIIKYGEEQRKITQEQKALQTKLAIENIKEQTDAMRQKAITQLCMGIIAGSLSITQGIVSSAVTLKNTKHFDEIYKTNGKLKSGIENMPKTRNSAEANLTSHTQLLNSSFSASQTLFNSISQSISTFFEANIKDMEAELEGINSMKETLQALDNSFKELIEKAIQVQDLMQQQINQTRAKILG